MPHIRSITSLIFLGIASHSFANTYDLHEVFAWAIENNPSIVASRAKVHAAEGQVYQAGMRPNPKFFAETENFGGQDALGGFRKAETTLGIEQTIELSGKRKYRKLVAQREEETLLHQQRVVVLELLAKIQSSASEYVIAQKRLESIEKASVLLNEMLEHATQRVQAGASSQLDINKLELKKNILKLELQQAEKSLELQMLHFQELLGVPMKDFSLDDAFLATLPEIPQEVALLSSLRENPQFTWTQAQVFEAESELQLAKAQSRPDPALSIGVRDFRETDNKAFTAGFSIQIPIFDRKQGEIQKAQAHIRKAKAEQAACLLSLEGTGQRAHESFVTAWNQVHTYKTALLPNAEAVYQKTLEGYTQGRFSFLDLMDAQRTLYEVEQIYLNKLSELHQAKAQTDFLMGTHLELALQVL